MGGNKDNHVLKMVLTAIFAGMGFALSSVVWFPNMAPFQHFINVLAAVFVGPYWGFLAALITGILRMMTGRTALAVIGAVIGAFLSGFLYRKSGHKLYMAVIGEIFGTGILSAFAAYPVMKYIYGMDLQTPLGLCAGIRAFFRYGCFSGRTGHHPFETFRHVRKNDGKTQP